MRGTSDFSMGVSTLRSLENKSTMTQIPTPKPPIVCKCGESNSPYALKCCECGVQFPRKIKSIHIEFIYHEDQRYSTCGDWFYQGDALIIRVSKTEDERYQQLVAVHELVEVLLCNQSGVTQEAVDAFDMSFEEHRPEGDESEPGDDPKAPYRREHNAATGVERLLCALFGVNWHDYEQALLELDA